MKFILCCITLNLSEHQMINKEESSPAMYQPQHNLSKCQPFLGVGGPHPVLSGRGYPIQSIRGKEYPNPDGGTLIQFPELRRMEYQNREGWRTPNMKDGYTYQEGWGTVLGRMGYSH